MNGKDKALRQEKAYRILGTRGTASVSKKRRGNNGTEEVGSHDERESAFRSAGKRTNRPEQAEFGGSPNGG